MASLQLLLIQAFKHLFLFYFIAKERASCALKVLNLWLQSDVRLYVSYTFLLLCHLLTDLQTKTNIVLLLLECLLKVTHLPKS